MECMSSSHRCFSRHCHCPSHGYGWCLWMHREVCRPSIWQYLQPLHSPEASQYLFWQRSRDIENSPSTQAALLQYTLRGDCQGGHVWGQALVPSSNLPDPSLWEWQRQDGRWTLLSTGCRHLLRTHTLQLQERMQKTLQVCQNRNWMQCSLLLCRPLL